MQCLACNNFTCLCSGGVWYAGITNNSGFINMLGDLSKRYESNGNPAAIGYDRVGGWSYGAYQISCNAGTMSQFIVWLAEKYPEFAQKLQMAGGAKSASGGSMSFKSAWVELANDPDFAVAQHEFIKSTHYEPLVIGVRRLGLDIADRSGALQDVAWSTAVQHGVRGGINVFRNALDGRDDLPDSLLIPAIYKERRGHFGNSTERVRDAVMRRFDAECNQAMAMLGQQVRAIEIASTPQQSKNNDVKAENSNGEKQWSEYL